MLLRNAVSLLIRRFRRNSIRRAARTSGSATTPSISRLQPLEDRTLLSADCYASLFAGPRLASLDSSESEVLEASFNALLPGSHVDLTVADWNAIAGSGIGVNTFLTALQTDLGVSTPAQALAADATLTQLFTAAADAVPADGDTADLHAALLDLATDVDAAELGGTVSLSDLLAVTFPDGSFADVDLDTLNLVTGLVQLYNYENVVTTNDPVTISGSVLGDPTVVDATIWAQVIEPPVIDTLVQEGDQFHSAAVRVKLDIDIVELSAPLDSDVSLGSFNVYLDVARAQGEVTSIDTQTVGQPQVVVDASHGVTHVYLGEIDDSLFFNRTHVIDPAADLSFGAVGSLDTFLGPALSVEARGFAEGTAPFASTLQFFGPFPETQTAGTSTVFIANAVEDLLASTEVQLTLLGIPVADPTGGIRAIVTDALHAPLVNVGTNIGDPVLDQLGTGIGEMDVTILDANCPPLAVDDARSTPEDTPIAIDVTANDIDRDSSPLDPATVTVVTGASSGTTSVAPATGVVTYTPNADFNGTDTFVYTVADSAGLVSNEATVTITVTPVNDAPVALDDAYTTPEDTTLVVPQPGVLANDADADNGAAELSSVIVSGPGNGSLTLNADGSLSYTPNVNFNGTDTFTYRANDGVADSNLATVTITVTPQNDPPVAVNDAYSTAEDTTLNVPADGVLGNDSDVDGDALASILDVGPNNGALTLNADGSFSYTPNTDFNGTDSFTYHASDGTADSNVATVTIQVGALNAAPVASDDSFSSSEDMLLSIPADGFLSNDTDAEGDALTSALVSGPANGTLTLNPDGSFDYQPNPDFNGTDSFRYQANDGTANSNIATVTLNVAAENDPPVAVDDSFSTLEDSPLSVPAPGVLINDSDIDGDPLTGVLVTGVSNGTLTFQPDGSFDYTPRLNFIGTDSFTYQVNDGSADGNVATVTINVGPANDRPVAVSDSYSTSEDITLSVPADGVLANDSDQDGDPLTSILQTGPLHGSLTFNADGSFDYTPDPNFNGNDSLTYVASDGTDDSNIATVTITVGPANDPPIAQDDSYATSEDTPLSVSAPGVLSNDGDVDGDLLTSVLVAGPTNGTLSLSADGSFLYAPVANFNGTDTFTYRASDGTVESNVATVTITVAALNDPPVARNDQYSTTEDTTLNVVVPGVLSNDSDVDGDSLTSVLDSGPGNGTLTLNADGSFSYTPDTGFSGTDTFTYHSNDGAADSNVATVTIAVGSANSIPIASDDSFPAVEDTPLSIPADGVLSNDTDADSDPLTSVLVNGPMHGSLTLNPDGSFDYLPDPDFNGPDTFTYQASDGTADSNVATVTINVAPRNDQPVAIDDTVSTPEDTPLIVPPSGVLANDFDVDGDPLSSSLQTGPANGTLTLNSDGSFEYSPDPGFHGTDSFTYIASDGTADSNPATVMINVGAVNDAPIAVDDAYTTAEDTPLDVPAAGVLTNDSDADGDPLTATLVQAPMHGSLTFSTTGEFSYSPERNFNGTDTFTYRVHDGTADSNIATVTITITPVNDRPVAVNDRYSTPQDTTLHIPAPGVISNDSDPENDPLTLILVSEPNLGTATINPDGSFDYVPHSGINCTDIFTYRVTDGQLDSNNATVRIAIGNDTTSPTLTITPDHVETTDDPILFTFRFNEPIEGFTADDVSITNGSAGTFSIVSYFEATLEVSPHATGDVTVSVAAGAAQDLSGHGTEGASATVTSVTSGPAQVTLDPAGGNYELLRDGTDLVIRFVNGVELFRRDASTITWLSISGSSEIDLVTVIDTGTAVSTPTFFSGAGGDDRFDASLATASVTLVGNSGDDVLVGGSAADWLTGGSGADELVGGTGDDSLNGSGGTGDTLEGGDGNDTLNGGAGNDIVRETFSGDVTLTNSSMAGRGSDMIIDIERAGFSGSAAPQLFDLSAFYIAGMTSTRILSGGGTDTVIGTLGGDIVFAGAGDDRVLGDGGRDRLFGGAGSDTLAGEQGDDLLRGQGGSGDWLIGGDGNDTLEGGAGMDRVVESGDVDFTLTNSALTGRGSDLVVGIEVAELNGGASANVIDVSAFQAAGGFTMIRAGAGDDSVIGSPMRDVIHGGAGNDTLLGRDGNDLIDGEEGDDRLSGHNGNDAVIGGPGSDIAYGGNADDTLTGDEGFDLLFGGDDDDSVAGGSGQDTLVGGQGDNDPTPGNDQFDDLSEVDEAFSTTHEPWVDQI